MLNIGMRVYAFAPPITASRDPRRG